MNNSTIVSEVLHPLITVYTSNNPLDTILWRVCFVVSGSRKVVGLSFFPSWYGKTLRKAYSLMYADPRFIFIVQFSHWAMQQCLVQCEKFWYHTVLSSHSFRLLNVDLFLQFTIFLPIFSQISHNSRLIIWLFWMRHQQVSKTGNWLDGANVIQLRR